MPDSLIECKSEAPKTNLGKPATCKVVVNFSKSSAYTCIQPCCGESLSKVLSDQAYFYLVHRSLVTQDKSIKVK